MNPVPSPLFPADAARAHTIPDRSERAKSGSHRVAAPMALPWRSAAKLMLSAIAVAGLAWLGARNAASKPPPPDAPAIAAASSAAPAASSAGSGGERDHADAGAARPAESQEPRQGVLPDGRVVLNLADEQDLRKLPGIGASRAAAILALRAKLGRFRVPRDLLRVRGIGVKMLRRLEPRVVVDPPPEQKGDAG